MTTDPTTHTAHGLYGFNGSEAACTCDRKWLPTREWEAHLVAARVAAARAEALQEAERAIATSMSHNWTLRHDGTEDPIAAAFDDGQREACQVIAALRAVVSREPGEGDGS